MGNFSFVKTDSKDADFVALVKLLDQELAIRDGDEHDFYHQFNHIDQIKYVIVAYTGDKAVGCGAIKKYDQGIYEIKRMYVLQEYRGKAIAVSILKNLEAWAYDLSVGKLILETGVNQPEAIKLYQKYGFKRISNYGQYAEAENSLCFEKKVNQ